MQLLIERSGSPASEAAAPTTRLSPLHHTANITTGRNPPARRVAAAALHGMIHQCGGMDKAVRV